MRSGIGKTIGRVAVGAGTLIVLWWALAGTEFEPARLQGAMPRFGKFLREMFPPDWSVLGRAIASLRITVQMAILGTVFGAVAALPVSFLAARTSALPRWFSISVKTVLNVLRAIPSLVYAVLFVSVVGLGPFTGVLAISIGSFVFLAKLYAESLESVHHAPIEAVKAVGGSPMQVFAYGMLPQALPQFLSHTLYSWELNIGAATVVGIVGAGGIGFEMVQQIRYYDWPKVSVYVLVIVAMVLLADAASYRIRKRFT